MRLINILAVVVLIIFGLHAAGTFLGWYVQLGWFDIPMHIMGGMFIALLFFYLFTERSKLIDARSNFVVLLFAAVGFVALIGVLWEFYEYLIEVFLQHQYLFTCAAPGSLFDTLKDLFDDLVGGTLATLVWLNSRSRG